MLAPRPSVLADFPERPRFKRALDRLAAASLIPLIIAIGAIAGGIWLERLR